MEVVPLTSFYFFYVITNKGLYASKLFLGLEWVFFIHKEVSFFFHGIMSTAFFFSLPSSASLLSEAAQTLHTKTLSLMALTRRALVAHHQFLTQHLPGKLLRLKYQPLLQDEFFSSKKWRPRLKGKKIVPLLCASKTGDSPSQVLLHYIYTKS